MPALPPASSQLPRKLVFWRSTRENAASEEARAAQRRRGKGGIGKRVRGCEGETEGSGRRTRDTCRETGALCMNGSLITWTSFRPESPAMHGATDTPIQRSRVRACTRAHTSGCPGCPGTGRHLCNGASCASAVAMHLRHPGLLQLAGTSSPCRVYRRAIPYPPFLLATVKRIPLCLLILNRYSPKRAVPRHWLTPESERLLAVNELPRERQHAKNSDRAARPLSARSILTNSRFVSVREFAWGNRYSRCGKSWVRATRAPSHLRTSRAIRIPPVDESRDVGGQATLYLDVCSLSVCFIEINCEVGVIKIFDAIWWNYRGRVSRVHRVPGLLPKQNYAGAVDIKTARIPYYNV